jgi:hypothetical protein
MSNAPYQIKDLFRPKRHTCIFELEMQNGRLTGYVVCRVCGVQPSSPEKKPIQTQSET